MKRPEQYGSRLLAQLIVTQRPLGDTRSCDVLIAATLSVLSVPYPNTLWHIVQKSAGKLKASSAQVTVAVQRIVWTSVRQLVSALLVMRVVLQRAASCCIASNAQTKIQDDTLQRERRTRAAFSG